MCRGFFLLTKAEERAHNQCKFDLTNMNPYLTPVSPLDMALLLSCTIAWGAHFTSEDES